MSKRAILISGIMVLIFLAMALSAYGETGTCFDPTGTPTGSCDYPIDGSQCTDADLVFYSELQPQQVADCSLGCCCAAYPQANQYYWIRRGTCEIVYEDTWLDITEAECNALCPTIAETPLCLQDCQESPQPCIGKDQEEVEDAAYYCWRTGDAYENSFECLDNCQSYGQCSIGPVYQANPCRCGGVIVSGGFCCPGDTHADSVGNCPESNDCMLEGYECCDGCLDDNNAPNELDYACDTQRCCDDCAPEFEECCDFNWQCNDILPYNYESCGDVPCDESCLEHNCIFGERINSGINDAYPQCKCDDVYYNTATDRRYCCDTGISNAPCEVNAFDLKGYIIDAYSGEKIEGANLELTAPTESFDTTSDTDGLYIIEGITWRTNLAMYAYVSAKGYYPWHRAILYPDPYPTDPNSMWVDIEIYPLETYCDEENPPVVDNFEADISKGIKGVNLTWENPCTDAPSKVIGYSIRREPAFTSGKVLVEATEFVDYSVNWSNYTSVPADDDIKEYTYHIEALYVSGSNSSEESVDITMGHHYCEGVFDDEQMCLTDLWTKEGYLTEKFRCDANNDLDLIQGCSDVCVGPDADGNVECKSEYHCKLGVEDVDDAEYGYGNPFGMFYTESDCLGSGGDHYCYYDYSDRTIVEDCIDCEGIGACQEYISEGACVIDNCGVGGLASVGGNDPCEWYAMFEEFGKGFCYDEDYDENYYCDLCGSGANSVFLDSGCEQDICSKLGACYSELGSCESCYANTECEEFTSEASCINANSLNRNRTVATAACPAQIIGSDDACNIGACKWGDAIGDSDPEPRCFKDSDDDNVPDCGDESCREDFEPFETIPINVPRMGVEGRDIEFSFVGMGLIEEFYFCIDEDNSCCPTVYDEGDLAPTDTTLSINPMDEVDIEEVGTYYIRYYSKDSNMNIEEIKTTEFYVDPIIPNITFSHVSNNVGVNYTNVSIYSTEYVECVMDESKSPLLLADAPNDLGRIDHNFYMYFEDLDEGNYVFTVDCNDSVSNKVEANYSFYVDNVRQITLGYPHNEVLNKTDVEFDLTTTDESNCTMEAVDVTINGIPYNPLDGEPIQMIMEEITPHQLYNHTASLSNLQKNVSYVVRVTCTPVFGGAQDNAYYFFTVDKEAPITKTDFNFNVFHDSDALGMVTVEFECEDPEINGTPGEAGCAGIYLCEGLDCYEGDSYTLLTDDEYSTASAKYISYYSVDNKGNKESKTANYNKRIKIDEDEPAIVTIDSPVALFTNHREQNIIALVKDNQGGSGISYVEVLLEANDYITDTKNKTNMTYSETLSNGHDKYILEMNLYDGFNTIAVIACDEAINCRTASRDIYLDIYGPEIEEIDIADFDGDTDIDNEFEYRMNLTFEADIEDKHEHGDNQRDGVGVNVDSAILTITDSTQQVVYSDEMNYTGDDHFVINVTQELDVGVYNATITVSDNLGTENSRKEEFTISDSIAPSFVSMTLYDQNQEVTELSVGTYKVNITVDEEMGIVTLNYSFTRSNEVFKEEINLFSLSDLKTWVNYSLVIPSAYPYTHLDATLDFKISGKDKNGNDLPVYTVQVPINTIGPSWFDFIPSVVDTVYSYKFSISGITEPDSRIVIEVYNNSARVPADLTNQSEGYSLAVESPTGIINRAIREYSGGYPSGGAFPSTGDEYLFFEYENLITQAFNPHRVGAPDYYLQFSPPHGIMPRYEVLDAQYSGGDTWIKYSPTLRYGLDQDTNVSVYTEPYPQGWFNVTVNLTPGYNKIFMYAEKDNLQGDRYSFDITYDTELLNLALVRPEMGGLVTRDVFYPGGSPYPDSDGRITIEASTDLGADCYLINPESDDIAKEFDLPMSSSSDGKTHTITLDQEDCAMSDNPDGVFCYLNNDGEPEVEHGVYHEYIIACDSDDPNRPSESLNICFGIATWSMTSQQERGKNICDGATGCTGGFPEPCGELIVFCGEGEIQNPCMCDGATRNNGYCCNGHYQTDECSSNPPCGEGEISYACVCGGDDYGAGDGYCCNNQYQTEECGEGDDIGLVLK